MTADAGQRREPAFEDESAAYTMFRRGMELLDDRHPAQAAMLLAGALRREPQRTSIREGLARAEYALGRYERAAEHFEAIINVTPDSDSAHYCLGRCLIALGRMAQAGAHLRLARALEPGSARYRQAVEMFDKAR